MSDVTVIVPCAPMPSHPSTEVLDETLDSIRERLPDSEIILMFDGVPSNLMHLKANYEEYITKMLWRTNHEMTNVTPLVFQEHHHQSLMTKEALKLVRTPLIYWSEQDTPAVGSVPIDDLSKVVLAGYANSIRLYHEASVPDEHQYLMLDKQPIEILGVPLIRNRQWSGRPSLMSTKFFRHIADKYLDGQPRFIEHALYGIVVHGDFDEFRLHLYAPEGSFVRHIHTDGRRRGATVYDPTPS